MNTVYRVPALRLPINGDLSVPGSKSHANRAIICAVLSNAETEIRGATPCDDVDVMVKNLKAMGFSLEWIDHLNGHLICDGALRKDVKSAVLDCHNAGTTLRFLSAVAALVPGEWTLTGDKHMRTRPIGDLTHALRSLGASIQDKDGLPPLQIQGGTLTGSHVKLKASISSQYLSALLLVAPKINGGLKIEIEGKIASEKYVDLTRKVMADFALTVPVSENTFFVQQGEYRTKNVYKIEGDWSAAGAWLVLEAISGSAIRISNLDKNSLQADSCLPDLLGEIGLSGDRTIDASAFPDQVMNLAVFAAFRNGTLKIIGAKNLRIKECDRLHVITTELRKAGIDITEQEDGIIVRGGALTTETVLLDPHDDHRMAMCFAILGLLRGNISIKNHECVKKSYPRFFEDLEGLLQSHRPVTVIGMRGVGKSNLGRRLARKLGSTHEDSDHLFEKAHGPIKKYIAQHGWDSFRQKEEEIIIAALRPGIVLSLGGGSLTSSNTRRFVKEKSIPVWLQASEKELIKRLESGKRPPLTDLPLHEEVRKFLLERGPQYREVAQMEISPNIAFGQQVPFAIKALTKLVRTRP
jgi:3-phosphoshikimate 1-carboxyvinyltransferase